MKGKNFFIVGGSGGIGSELTESLLSKGANVFSVSRSRPETHSNPSAIYHLADMSSSEPAKSAFDKAFESFGKIDGVVNLAGSIFLKPAHLTSDKDLDEVLNQNLKTAFNCIKYAYPHISSSSSVVLMASVAGVIGLQNHDAISAAKAAVIGLAKSAAATYASKGMRINCIAPGLVESPMSERIVSNKNALAASKALHPLGRIGTPKDIVPFIILLLSEETSWVTAQVFGIDGGLSTIK
jgi:NAD(P)-dependent dehydrogenase (short-subunit alcohol dehydrogenase family)